MAGDLIFNVAKGRLGELYERVRVGDPSACGLIIVLIDTPASDDSMRDCATLAAVLSLSSTAEIDNNGYDRLVITDADSIPSLVVDNANNRQDIGAALGDLDFGDVDAGDSVTNVVIAYAPDTSGADSTLIPLSCHAWAVSPNGANLTAVVQASGFARAS